jgi:hypothetical protein
MILNEIANIGFSVSNLSANLNEFWAFAFPAPFAKGGNRDAKHF